MADATNQFSKTLYDNGQSLTRPRKLVFQALQNSEPMTMGALIRRLDGKTDRASVYRTVALFEKLRIVHRIQVGWKYLLELSDDFQQHHHHLHCVSCGSVTAMSEDTVLEDRLRLLAANQQYAVQSHSIEIRGLCPKCQQY